MRKFDKVSARLHFSLKYYRQRSCRKSNETSSFYVPCSNEYILGSRNFQNLVNFLVFHKMLCDAVSDLSVTYQ